MNEVKLGKLIDHAAQRDAIHIAVAPVVAQHTLAPGERVGFVEAGNMDLVGAGAPHVGIVDPFLKDVVLPQQRFWMLMYPGTITSLRHEWEHPAFQNPARGTVQESIAWLTEFAKNFDLDFSGLMQAIYAMETYGDYFILAYDTPDIAYQEKETMWRHYEIVTGTKVEDHDQTVFSCSC